VNLTAGQVRGNLSIAVMPFGRGVLAAVGFFVVGLPLLFRPCSHFFGRVSPQGARLFPVERVELIPVGVLLS
jgi:hypothetical protein